MLLRNDLLQYESPRRVVRILWLAPDRSSAYVFDVAARACEARQVRIATLEEDVSAGRATRLAEDPYLVAVNQDLLPPRHVELRDRAWQIVAELTAHEPGIYQARRRGQLIADYTARYGISHPTIYRYLRRYWQRGQTPNALLPDYGNSGARGKTRSSTVGVKRGRPRKEGAPPGVNVDTALRRVFRVAAADATARQSRRALYDAMLGDFFCQRSVDGATGRVVRAAQPEGAPSFGQFGYWLEQDKVLQPVQRPLPLPGEAAVLQPGKPGAAFRLDAVRADVQLVARAERDRLAGRPVVYVASDIFSGMIVGFHVSLEEPSWQQAVLALAHCAADKVRFGQRVGRAIAAADWPCRHLPELLVVPGALRPLDGGGALRNNFGVRCISGTPDSETLPWRAALERRCSLLPLQAPAAGAQMGMLDGVLDLDRFTRLVADAALEHNLLPAPHGPAPLQLWDWGMRQRGAALKQYREDLVHCLLLPVHEALVTPDGICLHDTYYSCARAIEERWFERARLRGRWTVRLACDPADVERVYLLDPAAPLQFHRCHVTERSSAQRALSRADVAPLPQPALLPAGQHASYERRVGRLAG
ncbi:Mu transposase C-terminal domain-containing protein [Pseudoduganella chitinolytica]|uniref:Mu transposase C-terminal domain-containing protein n=1 Tax=Pseudoduganella chitinolytica TaxID=34070 RepID=A0ABY8B9R3_9BURK|nr:Mu transposase C-terminal domain-containing protein [Pseudoduganella chitinolytica]WEF32672.1 Mu transposase C-terminal domain-containing protein [Pseudoduganella chitinolytica]